MNKLKAIFLLPMLAVLGCPSSQGGGACLSGMRDNSGLHKWEAKQDVKWNRMLRTINRRLEN